MLLMNADSTSSGISNLGSPIVIPPTIPSSPPLESQLSESESSGMSAASPLQAHIQTTGSFFIHSLFINYNILNNLKKIVLHHYPSRFSMINY